MTGRVAGKIALVTGAARGQGRAHAIRLAEEGADIIAIDICAQVDSVPYAMSTPEDLAETVSAVEALDRRIVSSVADIRDFAQLEAAVSAGVAELGGLDIVCANAGVFSFSDAGEISQKAWEEMIAINMTGQWHTVKAAQPHLLANNGGSIVMTSSAVSLKPVANVAHYVTAKHGVVGIMRSMAVELAPYSIRVNSLHPTSVGTKMILNEQAFRLMRPDLENPGPEDAAASHSSLNLMPVSWIDSRDVSNAVLFLASDESRYITGVALPIDAGYVMK